MSESRWREDFAEQASQLASLTIFSTTAHGTGQRFKPSKGGDLGFQLVPGTRCGCSVQNFFFKGSSDGREEGKAKDDALISAVLLSFLRLSRPARIWLQSLELRRSRCPGSSSPLVPRNSVLPGVSLPIGFISYI
jgi:hypothetical protein